jgi:tetratricopeptide (TPR) repeat protein
MNLNEMLPEGTKKQLNEYEIFLLLCGTFLHDVGIMCAANTEEENRKIRETHHERSRQFVVDNLKEMLNNTERDVIGQLCYAHRDSVPMKNIQEKRMIRHESIGNKEIRVRFLAACLRLADSLELCHTRSSPKFVEVSKIPEESKFYHALHERISGISFNSEDHAIYLDFGIAAREEKALCEEYVVQTLQNSLNSVKDVLAKNGLIYIEVTGRYVQVGTLMISLEAPKSLTQEPNTSSRIKGQKISEADRLQREAYALFTKGKYKKSLGVITQSLAKDPKSAMSWYVKGLIHQEIKDYREASTCMEEAARLEPTNYSYLNLAGHLIGEYAFDFNKSLYYLEKAYQLRPQDEIDRLNYAEALITVGQAQKGYNLAEGVWNHTTDQGIGLNSHVIMICALFSLRRKKECIEGMSKVMMLLNGAFPSLKEKQTWVFNKMRRYLSSVRIDKDIKKLLGSLIDLASFKISMMDFSKQYEKYVKSSKQ